MAQDAALAPNPNKEQGLIAFSLCLALIPRFTQALPYLCHGAQQCYTVVSWLSPTCNCSAHLNLRPWRPHGQLWHKRIPSVPVAVIATQVRLALTSGEPSAS